MLKRIALAGLLLLLLGAGVIVGTLVYQGKKKPSANAYYVALGSSFASGPGLGKRVAGSPMICQRTVNSYPQQLARLLNAPSFTDMSCGGATLGHVLNGGQMFQGPQVDALGPGTELVTLTGGGNDVAYVGDLLMMAAANGEGVQSWVAKRLWKEPKRWTDRDFDGVARRMEAIARQVSQRSPRARIVFVTYPALLPESGACPALGLTAAQAEIMRPVARKLAQVTIDAARRSNGVLVDMAALSRGHDVCSKAPWVNGAHPVQGAGFHPNVAGMKATANAIKTELERAKRN